MYAHPLLVVSVAALLADTLLATTLEHICSPAYITQALPPSGYLKGITVDTSSVVATTVQNVSMTGTVDFPAATIDFCNVTWAYSHQGRSDKVALT